MLDFFFARRAITGSRPCTCRVPFVSGGRYRGNSSHIWPTFGRPIPPFRFHFLSICLKSPLLLSADQSLLSVSISCRYASKAPCSYRQANPPFPFLSPVDMPQKPPAPIGRPIPPSRFHFLSNCLKGPLLLSAGQSPIPFPFPVELPQKPHAPIGRPIPPFRFRLLSNCLKSPMLLSAGQSPIPFPFPVELPQKPGLSFGRPTPHSATVSSRYASKAPGHYRQAIPPIPLLFLVDTPQRSQVSIGGQIKNTLESVLFIILPHRVPTGFSFPGKVP